MQTKRRNTLKSIGAGSVWMTPVIQTVVLPAHAQTSTPNPLFTKIEIGGAVFCSLNNSGMIGVRLFPSLSNGVVHITDPQADGIIMTLSIIATDVGGATVYKEENIKFTYDSFNAEFEEYEFEVDDATNLIEFMASALEPITNTNIVESNQFSTSHLADSC